MPYHIFSSGSAGGGVALPFPCDIKPLTRTIFDPRIFLIFSKSNFFHTSPTSFKSLFIGNYLDFGFKMAHMGNTGSYKDSGGLFINQEFRYLYI